MLYENLGMMSKPPQPSPSQDSNTTIETSSSTHKGTSSDAATSVITQGVGSPPRLSGSIMKRTMEKFSLSAQNPRLSKSEIQRPSQTRKRLFSLTKRGKDEQSIRDTKPGEYIHVVLTMPYTDNNSDEQTGKPTRWI